MEPPAHLDEDAAAAWRDIVRDAGKSVTLRPADSPLLEVAACQMALMREATRRVREEGMFVPGPRDSAVEHPALAVQRAAAATLQKALKDLSLTADTITVRERRDQRRAANP